MKGVHVPLLALYAYFLLNLLISAAFGAQSWQIFDMKIKIFDICEWPFSY